MTQPNEAQLEQFREWAKKAPQLHLSERIVQNGTQFDLQNGAQRASFTIYESGKIVVRGSPSDLLTSLQAVEKALESGSALPGSVPYDLDQLPAAVRSRIPAIDPVIVSFLEEAIRCLSGGALLGASFMAGAASEKAALILIESFGSAIADPGNRQKFEQETSNRFISRKWERFLQSFKSTKVRPTGPTAQDLETMLDNMFSHCRVTRNAIGHPVAVPSLDKAAVMTILAFFPEYLARIYELVEFYKSNPVVL